MTKTAITKPSDVDGRGEIWQVRSDGQSMIKVSILHKKGDIIAQISMPIINELHRMNAITKRWSAREQ